MLNKQLTLKYYLRFSGSAKNIDAIAPILNLGYAVCLPNENVSKSNSNSYAAKRLQVGQPGNP